MQHITSKYLRFDRTKAESNAAWQLHFNLKRSRQAVVCWEKSVATPRKHQLPRTSHGIELIQLQMWLDGIHGQRTSNVRLAAAGGCSRD